MDVQTALTERKSVRGFRSDPVPAPTLRAIFERAQRAPSWCNIQPWRAWVASGDVRAELTRRLTEAATGGAPSPEVPWPGVYPEPYGSRRRECGAALYGAMGIAREDKAARYGAWMRNYVAFDAPHIAVVGFDTRFGVYGALDMGCWLQSVLLAAQEEGVASCAMASLAAYPGPARAVFEIPDEISLAFGVALGFEDPDVDANTCRTSRQPLEDNVVFVG